MLAHRGQHWTLLQNGARVLWNGLHTVLSRAVTRDAEEEPGLITMETFRSLAWQPLHVAADCLLDMLFRLENELPSGADDKCFVC